MKVLFKSPFALVSKRLMRRFVLLFSKLDWSLFRNAKLGRRPDNGGSSNADDRRRDERVSGCLQ